VIPIEVVQLTKQFGSVVAVDHVDLSVAPGEIFFLLGPSGCGKTTLLRCLAGFVTADSGVIKFDGKDITHTAVHKRNTSMVFQSYALWPHMTVADNVAFGLKERKVPQAQRKQRVQDALKLVQIQELATRKPNQLSGGQQQRVALARALVVEPACLLLDEPLSNLDATLRLQMREQIRSLCKRARITAIYVTHDQKEALSIADRVAVLDHGKVRQVGKPQEIYRRPVDRFVAQFIGQTNLITAKVKSVDKKAVVVVCSFGRLVSQCAPNGLHEGQEVTVSLRPEAIRLGDFVEDDFVKGDFVKGDFVKGDFVKGDLSVPHPSGVPAGWGTRQNTLNAVITHSLYLGEIAQHRVLLGDSARVTVFEMNPRHMACDGQNVSVPCWIDPADVVVLL